MGWTISDFSGLKANGPNSNWRVGLFELCRAVNEREFETKTEFIKGDGTEGSDLSYADLLGLDSNAAMCGVNLLRIQGAITAMCLVFTQTAGGDDFWTVPLLEAAIGTSLTTAPEAPLYSRFWNAQRDALDLLLYTRRSGNAAYVSGTAETSRDYFDDVPYFPNTEAEAWGDIGYHSGAPADPVTAWSMTGPGSAFHIYVAGATDSSVAEFDFVAIPADVVKIKYTVEIWNSTRITPGVDPIEPGFHLGSAAGTISETSGPENIEIETTTNDFAGDNQAAISLDGGRPGSNPIPGLFSGSVNVFNSPSFVRAEAKSAKVYYDLTSVLTDQA